MDTFARLFRELKPYDKRICVWVAYAAIFNAFCVLAPLVNHYEPEYHCSYDDIWNGGHNQVCFTSKRFFYNLHEMFATCLKWYAYNLNTYG